MYFTEKAVFFNQTVKNMPSLHVLMTNSICRVTDYQGLEYDHH